MHSSTLDSAPSPPPLQQSSAVLHPDHGSSSSSHSSHSHSVGSYARDAAGDLLVAVATLVTEGRIPIVQAPPLLIHKRCGPLSGSGGGGGCAAVGKGAVKGQRGFFEGPHCCTALHAMGGGASKTGLGGGGGGGTSPQRDGADHCCNPADALCQKYERVRSEVLNLWQKGIPLCVEVFLKQTCSCDDVSIDAGIGNGSSLLLERWYLSVSHFRSPDMSSSSSSTSPTTFHNFSQLVSAIRSQLYFSQISAWLSPSSSSSSSSSTTTSSTPTPPLSFHYRLAIPGETFDAPTFAQQPAHAHIFPSTDLGNGLLLNVQLESLPRLTGGRVPVVKCAKCGEAAGGGVDEGGGGGAERDGPDGGRRSASPGEGGCDGGLFDDRMHTRCTLKGKHRCDDLDDFDGTLVNHTSEHQQLLSGKYKRLCHNDTVNVQRSPQRAAFNAPPSRRLSTPSTSCNCRHQQLPSTSGSTAASSSSATSGSSKWFDCASGAEEGAAASPAMVNQSIRFCYQSFGGAQASGVDGGGAKGDGGVKGGMEELNQNEKRNSVQADAEEPHKTPKLDVGDRQKATPHVSNTILDGLAVISSDLNKPQQRPSPNTSANTNNQTNNTGDYLKDGSNNNNNNKNAVAVSKCDVKCVQRLGRIGTSILHGCSKVLQTVSDTTTNSDIFNLSLNSKVNNTIYVDETSYQDDKTTDATATKACKMRDISNIHRQINQSAKYQSTNNHVQYNQSIRRKLTFDDDEEQAATIVKSKHPDSPIPTIIRSQQVQQQFSFPSSSNVCQKLTFDGSDSGRSSTVTSANMIEIPSPLDKAQFRKSLDNAASMVFHSRTGLPLTSSPAPVRRGNTCFGYDESIDSVSAIKSALFSGSLSTDDDSESDGSIVSPCSPDAFLIQQQRPVSSYYSHATVLTKTQYHHHHHHVKHNNNNNASESVLHQQQHSHCNKRRGTSSSHLLGTFEESALNGRLEPAATVHGFKAELGASGSFVPAHRIVPVTVFFYTFGDSDKVSSPYLGHINLGKKGYNVPRTGTVQVTLFNPLGTVVKMFVIMYDLADMPNNAQTFIRQRTLYMPTNCKDPNLEWGPKWLRYLIHLRFMSSKSGKIYLHSDIRMIIFRKCDLDTATAHGMDMCYELRSFTHMPQNPKYSPRK